MNKFTKLFTAFALLSGVVGIAAVQQQTVGAEAVTATKRVWATAKDISWWFNAGAQFGIETKVGSTYVKSIMTLEPNNQVTEGENTWPIYYLDIPINITDVQWFRQVGATQSNFTGFNAYGAGLFYVKDPNPAYLDAGRVFNTTKVVADFAATLDTNPEICNATAVGNAITTYNGLSTFDKAQFDSLQVGESFTGLQRITYLADFYSLSLSPARNIEATDTNKNIGAIAIIGILGVSAIAGYYFLKTKKFI